MTTHTPTDREVLLLVRDAGRYLAAVDLFRAEGYAPSWRAELTKPGGAHSRRSRRGSGNAACNSEG